MTGKPPPPALLQSLQVTAPSAVAETAIATVWRVRRADGTEAALKLYRGADMINEEAGVRLAEALGGRGMARIYATRPNAVLMEWLDGPPLSALVQSGEDDAASRALATLARSLHTTRLDKPVSLHSLYRWCEALFALRFSAECRPATRRLMEAATRRAEHRLAHQAPPRPLHGDLHHDNVHRTPRGDIAFDAKGLIGDPAFELANAFRNPKGAERAVRDPARIWARATIFAEITGISRQILLEWAAIKCALSIAWRAKGMLTSDSEIDLLARLLHASRHV
ncbi:MAG: aminoglycoside phosphotransferase family protein [Pseudomonadota bacterium]